MANAQYAVMGLAELTVLADGGDADAQYKLGFRYTNIDKDGAAAPNPQRGVHYFALAANQLGTKSSGLLLPQGHRCRKGLCAGV